MKNWTDTFSAPSPLNPQPSPTPAASAAEKQIPIRLSEYADSHLSAQVALGAWRGTTDPATGAYPDPYTRPEGGDPRMYRSMHAPGGYNFYYHTPDLVAAEYFGYTAEVNAYTDHFLSNCVLNAGIFCWGSHYFWDDVAQTVKFFVNTETPVAVDGTDAGEYEELRPFSPAWEILWSRDSSAVTTHLVTVTPMHIVNSSTGEFSRHSGGGSPFAFLEWLGQHVASLSWFCDKICDNTLLSSAQMMIDYAWGGRDGTTGLLVNCRNSASNRWDKHVATTETGAFAYKLLKAAEIAPEPFKSDWRTKAEGIVEPYLIYGWNADMEKYYGQLLLTDGTPVFGTASGTSDTEFRPGDYTDPWAVLFPMHDYPQNMALACLELFALNSETVYREGAERFAKQFLDTLPGRDNPRAFALHYAYIIFFFLRGAEVLGRASWVQSARRVAEEALSYHFTNGQFRSSNLPGWNEHGDGVGFLLLALIWLETGTQPDLRGMVL